jgi:peptidoglycan/xylan/chitin deacetylase (PgdA/CDA1 family)
MMYSKAFFRRSIFFVISFFLMTSTLIFTPKVSASINLISNPSAETGVPTDWFKNSWGTNTAVYTVESDAQDGTKSLKVTMDSYSNGDARWSFKDVPVNPNTQYTFSAYYKSNVPVEVDIDSTLNNGTHKYNWLGDLQASPDTWTQISYSIITATDASTLNIYLPIFSVGWVQVDSVSLTAASDLVVTPAPNPTPVIPAPAPTPPPIPPTPIPVTNGFSRPLISIDFDDGWKNAYKNGFPVLNEFGFKGSAMVVTDTTQNPARYNNLYMNANDVIALRDQGHKIGSHTVTHANLAYINETELQSEIINSKYYLEGLLGQSVNYIVTPFCSYNSTVTSLVQQYYSVGMRNCDTNVNTKVNFDKYNVKSLPILNTTTLGELQSIINTAKQNNQWLVLMYHDVKPGTAAYSVTQATLRSQMQAIKDSGIVVIPSEDAIAEIIAQ